MKDSVVPNDIDEFSSVLAGLGEQSSFLAPSEGISTPLPHSTSIPVKPSYQPYAWSLPNKILDIVDAKTNGRAGLVQRVISYLFFGGLAALVNLGAFYIMYYHVLASLVAQNASLGNVLSYIVAAELSIIANFIPNDRFTFNTLPGAHRPWIQRCLRFHMTTIVGSVLTFLLEFAMSHFTPIQPIIAEALATLIVLVYNFSFHHIFTYRHVKHA